MMKKNFSFNSPANSNIYQKINPNLILQLKESSTKLSKRQIEFGTPRPVREYKRFISFRESLTGLDPYYNFVHFRKRDIIKPLERPNLYEKYDIKNPTYKHNNLYVTKRNKNTKWAIGTAARAPDEERLPKKQQYKIYYFPPEYNNKEPEKYRQFSLKTDCIGIKIPKINKVNSEKSFLKMKAGYSISNETKKENQWVPFANQTSMNNISSKNYNIINFEPLTSTKRLNSEIMNKSLYFRKKCMGEYYDLTNVYNKNFNKEYSLKFEENPKRFYKYNGAFTNMYDASNRNGKITLPFDLKEK